MKVFVRAPDRPDGYIGVWHCGCTGRDAASATCLLYGGSHYSILEPEVAFTDVVPRRRSERRSGQRADAGADSRGRGVQTARAPGPCAANPAPQQSARPTRAAGSARSPPNELLAGAPDQPTEPVQNRGRGAQLARAPAPRAMHFDPRRSAPPTRVAGSARSPPGGLPAGAPGQPTVPV